MAEQPRGFARRNRHLLIALFIVAGFAVALWFVLRRDIRMHEAPLANVPRSAKAVLFVRVAPVIASPIFRAAINTQGFEAAHQRLQTRCGFDPLAQLHDLAVFTEGEVPSSIEQLAFIGRGPFEHEKLGRCLRDALRDDGQGEMRRIEIDGVPAVAPAQGDSRAVFLGLRGIAVGSLETVRRVIATVRDGQASAASDPVLERLWGRVATGREIAFVGYLPTEWQRLLRDRLGPARSEPILELLTGLRAVGVGARVTNGLGLGAVMVMQDEAGSNRVARAVEEKLAQARDNVMVSLTPLGPIVRLVQSERQGTDVVVSVDVNQERLDRLVSFVDSMTRSQANGGGMLGAPGIGGSAPAPGLPADDTIRPTP